MSSKRLFYLSSILLTIFFISYLFWPSQKTESPLQHIDLIRVYKAQRLMECHNQGKPLKTYRISLGFSPKGHKQQEGDGKTPEGVYFIEAKNIKSKFHKSLKISYPNSGDRKAASLRKASPGGDIMIHGLGKTWGFLKSSHLLHDWTLGCIAVTNEEIDEIFPAVSTGTRIEIFP